MRAIPFVKMNGTGNDFLMIDNRAGLLKEAELAAFARAACPHRLSAGGDGVILVEASASRGHDYRMRIFNSDGSEAEMCGNGSRCVSVFARRVEAAGEAQVIETLAGTLHAEAPADGLSARVQLSPPSRMDVHPRLDVLGEPRDVYFMNTGVPHAVIFVADLAKLDVKRVGAAIRYHEAFKPKGTNANFVQLLGGNEIRIRTYERGVEDETLACGTGATACAIVAARVQDLKSPVTVHVNAGSLRIHFKLEGGLASRPYLEGPVQTVYKGEYFW